MGKKQKKTGGEEGDGEKRENGLKEKEGNGKVTGCAEDGIVKAERFATAF